MTVVPCQLHPLGQLVTDQSNGVGRLPGSEFDFTTTTQPKVLLPFQPTFTLSSSVREVGAGLNGGLRREGSFTSFFKRRSYLSEDVRRDSGLATSLTTMGTDTTADVHDFAANSSGTFSIPAIVVEDEHHHALASRLSMGVLTKSSKSSVVPPSQPKTPPQLPTDAHSFRGITTEIPTGDFVDPFSSTELQFSKRGSVLWNGKKANAALDRRWTKSERNVLSRPSAPEVTYQTGDRTYTDEDKRLSQQVRLLYEPVNEVEENLNEQTCLPTEDILRGRSEDDTLAELPTINPSPRIGPPGNESATSFRSPSAMSNRRYSVIKKAPFEVAGGIEDWQDVDSNAVDRYGFIKPRRLSQTSTTIPSSPDPSYSPRPGSALQSPPPSRRLNLRNRFSTSATLRPSPSILSRASKRSTSSAYKSPKWITEASTMLSPLGHFTHLGAPIPDDQPSSAKAALERRREAKWEKMAKVTKHTAGVGTTYTFDPTDPKLISRTWKGIPDRWRATAWHSFLSASARRQPDSLTDAYLVATFHTLQARDCPDDVQIDLDVPRTVGDHVMFRRRYRGGQRLLFRLLRALALHFPATGYVQGMAHLAATLLCYYDEEAAFVMSVRLWTLRGVGELYRAGFEGLLGALDVFETRWLGGRPVGRQLERLGIGATAYGTKWYLTLFNYSIPFAAQLRVWDVFMLLGDGGNGGGGGSGSGSLDVLHATAAALLDGLQEVLMGSDFENAMKVLTSAVPLAREDVLMRVVKKEWKERRRR